MGTDDTIELYNLSIDPGMTVNLAAEDSDRASQLAALARDAIPIDVSEAPTTQILLADEDIEALRALGHIR